jgi:hypothetical protein
MTTSALDVARRTVRQSAVIHPDWAAEIHLGYLLHEVGIATTREQVEAWLDSPSLKRAQQLAAQRDPLAPLAEINAALNEEDPA